MDLAFEFIQQHGITTEAAYPYTAQDGTCDIAKVNYTYSFKIMY